MSMKQKHIFHLSHYHITSKSNNKLNNFINAKGTKYWPKTGISRMAFFGGGFEVLVFTNWMCACTCYKAPKQIFVSLPISLALGLMKYILNCYSLKL